MSREDTLRSLFDTTGFGLEIGPSYNPLLPKSAGYNVETLDHSNHHDLIRHYAAIGQDTSRIEPVTYVSGGRRMVEVIGKTAAYDFIFASHVIEHTTDFIGFLKDCQHLLKADGKLVLAVPDRRFTFDAFRPASTLGQVVEAHTQGRTRHSLAELIDTIALRSSRGGLITWGPDEGRPFALATSPPAAIKEAQRRSTEDGYADAHGWTFTPASFRFLTKALEEAGFICLREELLLTTGGFEFYVVLSRRGAGLGLSYLELLELASIEGTTFLSPGRPLHPLPVTDEAEQDRLRTAYEAVLRSRSWRVTAPLRVLGMGIRKVATAFSRGSPPRASGFSDRHPGR